MRMLFLVVLLFAVGSKAVFAQSAETTPEPPLLLEDVLRASSEHFPAILQSLAERRAAEGRAVAANGAFDLVFSADVDSRVAGFWSGDVATASFRQPIRAFGATIYGDYRLSDGQFPIYEDENFTNAGGEAKIGALFSLLRNRTIDVRRFKTVDSRLALEQADLEVFLTKIGVQHRAATAYWRWVAAGKRLEVLKQLRQLAEDRETGLEEQVRSGAIAAIFVTENRQNIMQRRRLELEARRDFDRAANNLSFYYRDIFGTPNIPGASRLPQGEVFTATIKETSSNTDLDVSNALAARPDLAVLRVAVERAERREELARNELRPQLDLTTEFSRDFGSIAEGGASRDSTDVIVGMRFSIPLQRREARGKLSAARAEYEAEQLRRRQTLEKIEVDIRNIKIDIETSAMLVRIADQEVEQSFTMERAERERFASGASDFFLVNLREEAAANARIRRIDALFKLETANVDYNAATVNTEKLFILK